MAVSLWLVFQMRGLLFFSGSFRMMILLSRSASVHFSLFASPHRMAVSFSSWRNVASFLLQPAISASISCSVGMKGILRVILHFGFSQCIPLTLMKRL